MAIESTGTLDDVGRGTTSQEAATPQGCSFPLKPPTTLMSRQLFKHQFILILFMFMFAYVCIHVLVWSFTHVSAYVQYSRDDILLILHDAFCTSMAWIPDDCVASFVASFPHDFRGLSGHHEAMMSHARMGSRSSPYLQKGHLSSLPLHPTISMERREESVRQRKVLPFLVALGLDRHIVLWQPAWSALFVLSSLAWIYINFLYNYSLGEKHFKQLFRSESVLCSATRRPANLKSNAG